MNFLLKFKGQNREEPLKSPRDITVEHRFTNKKGIGTSDGNQLKNYVRAYRKQIQLPISYESSIFASKAPQRCMNHNSVLTLFCMTDKKPLCVNCVNQSSMHKDHQIIPINTAKETLDTQLSTMIQKLEKIILPNLQSFIVQNQTNFNKVQRQLELVLSKIHERYDQMMQLIENTKKQHIKYYENIVQKRKQDFISFGNEFRKADLFLRQKIKEITEKTTQEYRLLNYNIVFHLNKLDSILIPTLGEYQGLEPEKVEKELLEIEQQLKQLIKRSEISATKNVTHERKESLDQTKVKMGLWKPKKGELHFQHSEKNLLNTTKQPKFNSKDGLKVLYTPREYPTMINSPRQTQRDHKVDLKGQKMFSLDKHRHFSHQKNDQTIKKMLKDLKKQSSDLLQKQKTK